MDFLLLLPGHVRVVIEVDGVQHYANDRGEAAPSKYADIVSGDRDLKLLGYEVFRFGGWELKDEETSLRLIGPFFDRLFLRYNVSASRA
jgi:very-short-patch-repair endonuclease